MKNNNVISIHFLQTFFCYPSLLTYIALYFKGRCPYKTTITFYILNHNGCLKRSSTTHCCAVIVTAGDTVTHAAIRTRDSHGMIWFTEVLRFLKVNEFTFFISFDCFARNSCFPIQSSRGFIPF